MAFAVFRQMDNRRAKRRDQSSFLFSRFGGQRFKDESARANDQLREGQLAGLAGKFSFRIARPAEGWFPIRVTRCFFAEQALCCFPISDGKIVDAF